MKQSIQKHTAEFDKPIPKPADDLLDKFLRSTEARFVTKRFDTQRDTHRGRGARRPVAHRRHQESQ